MKVIKAGAVVAPKTNSKPVQKGGKGKEKAVSNLGPTVYGKPKKLPGGVTVEIGETNARGTPIRVYGKYKLSAVLRYLGSKGLTPKEVGEVIGYTKNGELVTEGRWGLNIPYNTLFSQVNSGRLSVSGGYTVRDTPHHGEPPTDKEFPEGKQLLALFRGEGNGKAGKKKVKAK